MARNQLVDVSLTRYYHCISRCVRGAFLCGEGFEHRKVWIEKRLELLAECFAVSVCGFAVMDNHLHVLARLEPDLADGWSDEEILQRWVKAYPPRSVDGDDEKLLQVWINHQMKDAKRVAAIRKRLADLGWFMKALKEPLARLANKEDECRGAFWEGRYKSIAILDEEALLATCAYIDLNPVAAGVAATPETSKHTSIHQRVVHAREQGATEDLKAAREGSIAGSQATGDLEQDHWLAPIDDRRNRSKNAREGMIESLSLGGYLLLVDYTSRLFRRGKARVNSAVAEILDRIGASAEYWSDRMTKMLKSRNLRGRFFAGAREKLAGVSKRYSAHHVHNLSPR